MTPAALAELVAKAPAWVVAAGVTWLVFRLEVMARLQRRQTRELGLLVVGHTGDRFTHAALATTLKEAHADAH